MTINVVLTVARQIYGEMMFITPEKAFVNKGEAEALVAELNQKYKEPDGKIKPKSIQAEGTTFECACTASSFELELEEKS